MAEARGIDDGSGARPARRAQAPPGPPGTVGAVDIKIGIENVTRELSIETDQSREDITAALGTALASENGLLTIVDPKGRQVIVPAARIAYVEFGQEHVRQVGFGAV